MTVTITTTDAPDAKAVVMLQRMIALSATFAELVPEYRDRLERVWFEGVPDDELARRENAGFSESNQPFASVWPLQTGWTPVAGGTQNHVLPRGQIHVYLMVPRDNQQPGWNDARIESQRFLGNWMQDIVSLFGADDVATDGSPAVSGEGHLAGTLVDAMPPEHVAQEMQKSAGDFFFRHFAIGFGDGDSGGSA